MNKETDYIKDNIEEVRAKVKAAALRSGRDINEIEIIAVTKTVEPEKIIRAIDEGIINLGENRVQELREKTDIIMGNYNWHLIGYLQTNKVKYIIDKVKMIHSVDRLELVQELQIRASKVGRIIDILVQVNISGEGTKSGISPIEAMGFIKSISSFSNIKVKGLMTMAPYTTEINIIRPVFRGLKEVFIDIAKENIDNVDMDYLSMGMSNDYEIAVEEGANLLRIGTAIFGKR